MDKNINISIHNKIAAADGTVYICGNSDYIAEFEFDREWDAFEYKTARFIHGTTYTDVVFQGNLCPVPVLYNLTSFRVGVFAGDLTEQFIPRIKDGFVKTMKEKYGVEEEESNQLIESFLQVIRAASLYAFSLNHSHPYSFLGYAVGYLRCYHKLETVTTAMNIYRDDDAKCLEILRYAHKNGIELMPIKFGKSGADYTLDKQNNCIYKGIAAVKFCNTQIADELLELSKNKYDNFVSLLKDIKEKTSLNSRQLDILTKLNFFDCFGKNKTLLKTIEIFDKFAHCKIIAKNKMEELGVSEFLMQKYAGKETKSQWRELDNEGLIKELCGKLKDECVDLVEQVKAEIDYLGSTSYTNKLIEDYYYIVVSYDGERNPTRPRCTLHRINNGEEVQTRVKHSATFKSNPFGLYSVLKVSEFKYEFKKKKVGDEWVNSDEVEPILECYETVKE